MSDMHTDSTIEHDIVARRKVSKKRDLLHFATYLGNFEVVCSLLEELHPNTRSRLGGVSILHVASYEGHVDIVKYVIQILRKRKLGYPVTITNETPLHWAYRSLRFTQDEIKKCRSNKTAIERETRLVEIINLLKGIGMYECAEFTGVPSQCYLRPQHKYIPF